MTVKFPEIAVRLTDTDSNAFSIMGIVKKALRRNGVSQADMDEYVKESMSGDYDHLLRTTMQWVNVE